MWYLFLFIIVLLVCGGIFAAYIDNQQKKQRGVEMKKAVSSIPDFVPSEKIIGIDNRYTFMVDYTNRKICYVDLVRQLVIPFDKITNVKLVIDESTVYTSSTKRTVGGALVGGAVAGIPGAVIGGLSGDRRRVNLLSSAQVKIFFYDKYNRLLTIDTFNAKTMTVDGKPIKSDGLNKDKYEQGLNVANKITDIVQNILSEHKSQIASSNISSRQNASVVSDLKELATQKMNGSLSQEEFENQKAKLLNEQDEIKTTQVEDGIINDDFPIEIQELIDKGLLIQAVKDYMSLTGASLTDAKKAIDSRR